MTVRHRFSAIPTNLDQRSRANPEGETDGRRRILPIAVMAEGGV